MVVNVLLRFHCANISTQACDTHKRRGCSTYVRTYSMYALNQVNAIVAYTYVRTVRTYVCEWKFIVSTKTVFSPGTRRHVGPTHLLF